MAHALLIDRAGAQVGAIGVGHTASGDGLIVTASRRIAGVGGAAVAVVAIERRTCRALSQLAGLNAVADIGIAARHSVHHIGVYATACRIAGVVLADIAVITVDRIAGTRPVHAALVGGAQAGVGAVGVGRAAPGNRLIVTARRWVARQV